MLVENDSRTIAGKNSARGGTSVGEAWKPKTVIGMGHCSMQGLVLLDKVSELEPWDLQMATAGHENQTVEAQRLGAPGTGALPAAVAVASIVPGMRELGVHQKQSVDPDNGRLPYDYRRVEALVVAAHGRHNIPGWGGEAVGAYQRLTTLYVFCLGQALAGRRTMSWSGTSQEGGQRQRCLRTRHLVGNSRSGRDTPAGVGQEPVSYIDSRPCSLRCKKRDEISQMVRTREAKARGDKRRWASNVKPAAGRSEFLQSQPAASPRVSP